MEISFINLTATHILSSNNVFKVPNTIVVIYGGHAGEVGKALMQWNNEIEYLKLAGFYVDEVTKVAGTDLTISLQNRMQASSNAKQLQGIYIGWCHGTQYQEKRNERDEIISISPASIILIQDESCIAYSELGAINYKLGFVVIKACYSELGKENLLSQSTGARSWFTDKDRVLDPAFPFGYPVVLVQDKLNGEAAMPKTQNAPSIIVSALPPGTLESNSKMMIELMPGLHPIKKMINNIQRIKEGLLPKPN
jgi:hypothetical protein